eukprot:maker-scaffold_18-snap-gene-3.5-mRNA-1 protein AED:0.20 eAED:0.20 QI:0/0/0.5/1/0/0/2/887/234
MSNRNTTRTIPEPSSTCPVSHGDSAAEGCPVNHENMMPTNLQNNIPGLSSNRVVSSIPKASGAEEQNWIYPSESQFFAALKRKGWKDADAKDMRSVVGIHNAVNETAWAKVMEYEKMHSSRCDCPKLKKFMGRSTDLSPKARLFNLLGYNKPFDRHDWVVDRCGKEVRYVIDFYRGQVNPFEKQFGRVGMYVDARPALDSPAAVFDRIKLYTKMKLKQQLFLCEFCRTLDLDLL